MILNKVTVLCLLLFAFLSGCSEPSLTDWSGREPPVSSVELKGYAFNIRTYDNLLYNDTIYTLETSPFAVFPDFDQWFITNKDMECLHTSWHIDKKYQCLWEVRNGTLYLKELFLVYLFGLPQADKTSSLEIQRFLEERCGVKAERVKKKDREKWCEDCTDPDWIGILPATWFTGDLIFKRSGINYCIPFIQGKRVVE